MPKGTPNKVLILGNGGREHALAWRCARSRGKENVLLHPGNAGTVAAGFETLAKVDLAVPEAIARRAKDMGVALVVIGPEALLAQGYADTLRAAGLAVVGPGRDAARLESSKIFAKEFMVRADVPTAPFSVASSPEELEASLKGKFPVVVKLDGLASGKGVVVAKNREEVMAFSDRVWKAHEFGQGAHRVLVEEFLEGRELSYMGLCDGKTFLPLSSATDYKRVGDSDTGPNTGGMGAVSPSPFLTKRLEKKIRDRIVKRVLKQLALEKLEYRGVLYIGLMVTPAGDPYVLEFNARFGDPETQAVLMRLEGDFVTLLEKTAAGTLGEAEPPVFDPRTAIYVVAAAEGYPAMPKLGDVISGLESVGEDCQVFFSGVQEKAGKLATGGGRVLGVGTLADGVEPARKTSYAALEKIKWRGMHFRHDIGVLA